MASNCTRTLLLQLSRSAADQSIIKYILPRLITFVSDTDSEDPEKARTLISHALTTWATTLPKTQIGLAMAMIIPTLLSRTVTEGGAEDTSLYGETSSRLLEMAAADQGAFRSVVAGMTTDQRAFMEEVIKSGRPAGPVKTVENEEGEAPSIALRMNFGAGS